MYVYSGTSNKLQAAETVFTEKHTLDAICSLANGNNY